MNISSYTQETDNKKVLIILEDIITDIDIIIWSLCHKLKEIYQKVVGISINNKSITYYDWHDLIHMCNRDWYTSYVKWKIRNLVGDISHEDLRNMKMLFLLCIRIQDIIKFVTPSPETTKSQASELDITSQQDLINTIKANWNKDLQEKFENRLKRMQSLRYYVEGENLALSLKEILKQNLDKDLQGAIERLFFEWYSL